MTPLSQMQAQAELSAGIAADIERYLGNGGTVNCVPMGQAADTKPPRAMTINKNKSPKKKGK